MLKKTIAIGLIMSLSGCSSFFTGIDRTQLKVSGKKTEKIDLMLIPRGLLKSKIHDEVMGNIRKSIKVEDFPDEKLGTACGFSKLEGETVVAAAVAIPLIVAGAKLAFDLYMDAKIKEIEALKKAAQVSYSEKVVGSERKLDEYGCVLLIRPGKDNIPKLVALLHFKDIGGHAFQLEPRYVLAREAVAVTKENVEKGKKPAINISFAISVKALGRTQFGVTSFTPVGEGAISVSGLKIGSSPEAYTCESPQRPCPTSDLIAYPADVPWSVTVASLRREL